MKSFKDSSISAFHQKICAIEARGKEIDSVMMVIPSIIEKDNEFSMGVSILDRDKCPCFYEELTLEVVEEGNEDNRFTVEFSTKEISVMKVKCTVGHTGFIKFYTYLNGKKYYSNPAYSTENKTVDMLWGDPHVHTTVGDCHPEKGRTRNLAYTVARYVYHLQWLAIADHVSWNPRGTIGKWRDNVACAELFNDENEFTALIAYETSMRGGDGGDNNAYFKEAPTTYIDPWEGELNTKDLCKKLKEQEEDFFIVPHHTTRSGKHGEISKDIYPGTSNMPVIEIHSKWGSSEYRGNPNPLKEVHPGPSYTRDMLNRGLVMGFIAGTDSHSSLTFNSTLEASQLYALPGLTCTISKKNNRSSIFDAIKHRACYATSGERIFLDVTVNDKYSMGKIIKMNSEELTRIKIQCATESDIEEIIIIRNGNEVLKKTINGWNSSFEWVDDQKLDESSLVSEISDKRFVYYYVKVIATSGANCWSSPIWFFED